MQMMSPGEFLGKRVRMALWVKTENVSGWVAPWMRVDGEKRSDTWSFDNFCTRHIEGTTDWTRYEAVLDVPKKSSKIAFGIMLGGEGNLWLNDVSFEIVGAGVPTTDCPCFGKSSRAKTAVNLDFEEGEEDADENKNDCSDADSSEWKELKPLSASREGKLKSLRGDDAAPIEIKNETDKTVRVYWLDYDGKRVLKGTIKPSGIF